MDQKKKADESINKFSILYKTNKIIIELGKKRHQLFGGIFFFSGIDGSDSDIVGRVIDCNKTNISSSHLLLLV